MSNVAGRAVSSLWQQVSLRRVVLAYAALSIVVAAMAVFRAGLVSGLCALFAPPLMAVAAGGMKAIFFWGDRNRKIFAATAALLAGALAVKLAPGFSVYIPGHGFGGPMWTVIGGFIGFFASNRANWEARH